MHRWARYPVPEFKTVLCSPSGCRGFLPSTLASASPMGGSSDSPKLGVLKRIAYGFVNADNSAARALLWCPPMHHDAAKQGGIAPITPRVTAP